MIYITLHSKLKIEPHELHTNLGWTHVFRKGSSSWSASRDRRVTFSKIRW